MMRRRFPCAVLSAIALVGLSGCMPKMTVEEMKAMMPERPAELDALNAFVGTWDFTGEMRMAGVDEVLTSSGTSELTWEGDKWYLVGHGVYSMPEFGDMKGMETWMYDAKAKKYRTLWVDSMGSLGVGTATRYKKTDTWTLKGTSYGPFGKTTGKGTLKFADPNTMEWTWKDYAFGGLIKVSEMYGTSKRK